MAAVVVFVPSYLQPVDKNPQVQDIWACQDPELSLCPAVVTTREQ